MKTKELKLIHTTYSEESESIKLTYDGEKVFYDMCLCPEDNTYFRDHSDIPNLLNIIERIVKDVKSGCDVNFVSEEKDEQW